MKGLTISMSGLFVFRVSMVKNTHEKITCTHERSPSGDTIGMKEMGTELR
jgi:hypothetical protein